MMMTYIPDISMTSGSELNNGRGPEIVACSLSLVGEPGSDSGTSSNACLSLLVMLPQSMRGLVPSSGFLGHIWVRVECRDMGRGGVSNRYDKIFLFGVPTTTAATWISHKT
jgi:hypothetical protein